MSMLVPSTYYTTIHSQLRLQARILTQKKVRFAGCRLLALQLGGGPHLLFFAGSQWERESRSCARLQPTPDQAPAYFSLLHVSF
jgi:hypothetical protein